MGPPVVRRLGDGILGQRQRIGEHLVARHGRETEHGDPQRRDDPSNPADGRHRLSEPRSELRHHIVATDDDEPGEPDDRQIHSMLEGSVAQRHDTRRRREGDEHPADAERGERIAAIAHDGGGDDREQHRERHQHVGSPQRIDEGPTVIERQRGRQEEQPHIPENHRELREQVAPRADALHAEPRRRDVHPGARTGGIEALGRIIEIRPRQQQPVDERQHEQRRDQ